MTSAPSWARIIDANGPAMFEQKSTTRMPCNGEKLITHPFSTTVVRLSGPLCPGPVNRHEWDYGDYHMC